MNNFINQLSPETIKRYADILLLNSKFGQPDSILSNSLKPIRDHTSHYYDSEKGKRKEKFETDLIAKLKTLSDMKFHIITIGSKIIDTEYTYASEISFYLLFGADVIITDFSSQVLELGALNKEFAAFAEDLIEQYLVSKF